ncbi:sugar 3,4-ketoisomerase [Photobacterium sanguinicancri]|uniref:sugar 3,4-ketoisomerase n=1 Tax=Photobacterium sanguinicancri TaxID=875932 RepID=UPI0021C3CF96|nr:FdtA/QdtA family cupin domain-containing protein [Photobacterium sanguinicancri]
MDVNFINFQSHGDQRGSLVSIERNKNIPFDVRRIYYIFDTKSGVHRGFHAHKKLKQIAVVLKGSCRFILDNGSEKVDLLLDSAEKGLLIESFIWREMYQFSEDCILLVIADSEYDEDDYIRNYDEFKSAVLSNI